MNWRCNNILVAAVATLLCISGQAAAATYNVSIDTSSLQQGVQAQFAFDLIGNGALPNSVTISNVAAAGGTVSGVASTVGTVIGAFPGPVTLSDQLNFYNEMLINLTIGTSFSFSYSITTNVAQPQPTGFSGLFVNPTDNSPLFDTTYFGFLFLHSIDGVSPGGGTIEVFAGLDNGVTASISETPLPAALPLFIGGLAAVGWAVRRRKARIAEVKA